MVATTVLGWHGLVLSFIFLAMLVMMGAGRGHTTIAALWNQGAKRSREGTEPPIQEGVALPSWLKLSESFIGILPIF